VPGTVFANTLGIAHKGSGGMSTIFPDVCKTPTPAGPVPIPYPNIGQSSNTSSGPTTVTTDGQMPMTKGAKYMLSSGDEAGSAGGVMSGKIKGPCEFMMYSFDVKFEGKNVCRLADPLFHNDKNGMG
jgi:Toxin PAAR-like domain